MGSRVVKVDDMSERDRVSSERRVTITLRGDIADFVLAESFKYGVKPDDYIKILLRWYYEERGAIQDLRLSIQALTKAILALDERLRVLEEDVKSTLKDARSVSRDDIMELASKLKLLEMRLEELKAAIESGSREGGLRRVIRRFLRL